jgi:NAD(P)-dependent dehydrogenase (short-subunit alcohol dehydrogenase family)
MVNVTSITALNGGFSTPAYTGSKAAANCQTKAFARKYGKDNITVNAILPGGVDTPMNSYMSRERVNSMADHVPLGRVSEPIDVARVAMFLTQENLYITGQEIISDGGGSLGKLR